MRTLFTFVISAIALSVAAQSAGNAGKEVNLGLSVNWSGWYVNDGDDPLKADTYVWASPNKGSQYTGYNEYVPVGMAVGVSIAGTNYDAATAAWGDGWRLPTKAECEELAKLRPAFTTTEDGRKGFSITGSNGNSVFFEALNGVSSEIGYHTTFWTSDACLEPNADYTEAWACQISLGRDVKVVAAKREKTLMGVRAVRDAGSAKTAVTSITLPEQELTLPKSTEQILYAFAMPENASNRWLSFSSSDDNVATVDRCGLVKAVNAGTATITVKATDGSDVQAVCTVTVPGTEESCDVDMGVSMIWASHNVGADSEKEVGKYFQFANPSMEQVKWSAAASPYASTLNVPVLNVAGTEYDPATVNMGEGWMTPTKEQFEELFANCDRTDTADGIELTSKTTGNRLFFPFTGYMNVSALNAKSYGYYQTAVANGTHIVSDNYPCVRLGSGMAFEFYNLKINQGVAVRAVKVSPTASLHGVSTDNPDEAFEVYSTLGVKVASGMSRNGLKTLPHGLYIARGNKGSVMKMRL